MAYIGSAPSSVVSRQSSRVYRYEATAGQTVFQGADLDNQVLNVTPSDVEIHMNGLLLDPTDYTVTSTSVTLSTPATAGDELTVTGMQTFEVADTYSKTTADARYVNVAGDSMSGDLGVTGLMTVSNPTGSNYNENLRLPRSNAGWVAIAMGSDPNATSGSLSNQWSHVVYPSNHATYPDHFGIRLQDNDRIRIDNAGRVTMPYQPSFTGTYVGVTNGTTVVFSSVGHNDGNMYNASTGRFTAPVAGKYLYQAVLLKSSGSATRLDVIINGGTNHNIGQEKSYSTTAGYDHLIVNCVYKLQAGDWIDLNYVGALNSNGSNSDQYNCLSIILLG